jgi:DNA-binding response OmpR family regulator
LVEDELELARQIANEVRRAGFVVDCASSIASAIEAMEEYPYSLMLLDRRLPDGDAIQIVPKVRLKQPDLRVLVLSALDELDERIRGLDAGADDYLTKPCHLSELMARIRASLRRPGGTALPPVIIGGMSFDLQARTVLINGEPAAFHPRELALLDALIRRVGQFVRRNTLMSEIYGFDDEVQPHALTVLVARVRTRLNGLHAGVDIRSERGVGCMLIKSP